MKDRLNIRALWILGFAAVTLCSWINQAHAQSVPASAAMTWALPLDGCTVGVATCDHASLSGHPITGIEVFISTSPIPDNPTAAATIKLSSTSTTASYTTTVANGSTLYARVRAVGDTAGGLSAQASKLISLNVAPGVPTSVTFTIQITG